MSTPNATKASEFENVAGTVFTPSPRQISGAKSARMLRTIVIAR